METNKILLDAAIKWLKDNPGKTPEFSRGQGMIFNDNNAADEIEIAITEAGEKAGLFVTQEEIWDAVLLARHTLDTEP